MDQTQRVIKYVLIPNALFFFILSSCTHAPNTAFSYREFTGWFQQAGEFRLYKNQSDLGSLYDATCISGRFPDRQIQERANNFNNMRVTIRGRTANVKDIPIEGVPYIENYCNSAVILYGYDVKLAE